MKLSNILKEAVDPINVRDLDLEEQLEEINKRMNAAYRGMGIVNRMPDSSERTKHRSRIMSNLNVIRGMLSRVLKKQAAEGPNDDTISANYPTSLRKRDQSGETDRMVDRILNPRVEPKTGTSWRNPLA